MNDFVFKFMVTINNINDRIDIRGNRLINIFIRNNFLNVTSIKEADNYIQLLEKSNLKEANTYKAALLLMKAKFAFFPFNK